VFACEGPEVHSTHRVVSFHQAGNMGCVEQNKQGVVLNVLQHVTWQSSSSVIFN